MDKINDEEGSLTCANNFQPPNNRRPNELSAQHVKREQTLFTLSQNPGDPERARTWMSARAFVSLCVCVCCIVIALMSVYTPA